MKNVKAKKLQLYEVEGDLDAPCVATNAIHSLNFLFKSDFRRWTSCPTELELFISPITFFSLDMSIFGSVLCTRSYCL